MTPEILRWCQAVIGRHGLAAGRTLEIGSHDYNGSVRGYFAGEYHGIDLIDGPGVDSVHDAHGLPAEWTDRFDVVAMTEVLEHDLLFWVTLTECVRVLTRSGWLLLTTNNIGFPPHDYPADYYRFTPATLPALLEHYGFSVVEQHATTDSVMALGRRIPAAVR